MIQDVRKYLKQFGRDQDILELDASSATVELAAKALNVIPARIAKTLSLKDGEGCMLVVTAGDCKIDNSKFKAEFHFKPRMLGHDEAFEMTGHAVGGVCPFALPDGVPVYIDVSLKQFDTVFPACGSSNSAIELTPDELYTYSQSAGWADVCKHIE